MGESPGDAGRGVLIVYTGGTVGSVRLNPANPDDPLVPGSADQLLARLPLVDGNRIRFGNRLVPVDVRALPRLLDSTNINPSDWVAIARILEDAYDRYEGFVVLHGTDTLAFTASALAFMLENLAKPVVITGSQRSIGETRSDALQNVVTAVEIAAARSLGRVVVPEVTVFFRDELHRGCRVTKKSASAFAGFHSPNLGPLGVAGEHIRIHERLLRPPATGDFSARTRLDCNLAVLELSPLMSPEMLDRILSAEDLDAVVLKTYGAGNAPTEDAFLAIVEKAVARGVRVAAVSQCPQATVELGLYEVSAGLLERGVITGLDMTAEAAQAKLAVLLADDSLADPPEVLMQIDLRGEQSQSLFDLRFAAGIAAPRATVLQEGPFPAASYFRRDRIASARLLVCGLSIDGAEAGAVPDLRVCINDPTGGRGHEAEGEDASCAVVRWARGVTPGRRLFVDVTHQVRRSLDPRRKATVTLTSPAGRPVRWERMLLSVFTDP